MSDLTFVAVAMLVYLITRGRLFVFGLNRLLGRAGDLG